MTKRLRLWMIPQLHEKNGTITLQGAGYAWWFWGDDATTSIFTITVVDPLPRGTVFTLY